MDILQITSCQPSLYVRKTSQSWHRSPKPCSLLVHARHPLQNPSLATLSASNQQQRMPILKNQICRASSMYQHPSPVCLLGGKGKNGSDDKASAGKALENALGPESSIEDVLRTQIEKKEFYKEKVTGGGGGGRRGGGGGSGGYGGGGGSSGSEDGGIAGIINETLQVILATLGVVFMYVYIISGDELARLVKDYLKFLFSGHESARLQRAMHKWGRFYAKLTKKKLYDEFCSEEEGQNQQPDLVG
ncbi:uncharacterized protein LOC126793985 [Argentina anserina]|uniref:uncharacterized protein LOC126793985 n=1 Tax=Argentina anserina TaxID=57926 RepID=UPI0021763F6D|nr:uncharacterized protein LOC126793985 [Potentilla anserina]XP_050376592.1 uncharacterized protein LOC126793985 [Potentilla anserina]